VNALIAAYDVALGSNTDDGYDNVNVDPFVDFAITADEYEPLLLSNTPPPIAKIAGVKTGDWDVPTA
jgi:hypothetical protein